MRRVRFVATKIANEKKAFDLPPKNWSRHNVRVRTKERGKEWLEESTDLRESSGSSWK